MKKKQEGELYCRRVESGIRVVRNEILSSFSNFSSRISYLKEQDGKKIHFNSIDSTKSTTHLPNRKPLNG